MLTDAKALYGAAYQVLFERLDPDGCVDREAHQRRLRISEAIGAWIAEQEADVAAAYRRAMPEIMKRAVAVLENNERARQMREARRGIPVPPPEVVT